MKSISLDSPEVQNSGMNPTSGSGHCGINGLRHKNMSVPKIVASVADCQQNTLENSPKNNFGIGIGNRRYGAWANVVRSRMAAQQQAAQAAAGGGAGGEMAPAHAGNSHAQQLPSTNRQIATNCHQLPPRRPPNSMEFGVAGSSAPPSYNQCNLQFKSFCIIL